MPRGAASPADGATSSLYQRRAQFRMAMAAYQGRASRPVLDDVVEDVRQQIEATARHLINDAHPPDEPEKRYAAITRVHVLCVLRGAAAAGRFNRWYRESHYLHGVITRQPRPGGGSTACPTR